MPLLKIGFDKVGRLLFLFFLTDNGKKKEIYKFEKDIWNKAVSENCIAGIERRKTAEVVKFPLKKPMTDRNADVKEVENFTRMRMALKEGG